MTKKRIVVLSIGLIFIIAGIFAYNIYSKIFASNTTENTTLYIPTEATFERVVELISPYLENTNSFVWVAEKKKYNQIIKPGKYSIAKGLNNNDLVNLLRSGNQSTIKLTFNNQDTLEKLAGRISEQIEPDSITLLNVMRDETFLANNDIVSEEILGMYIPNSYDFYWNTSAEKFRDRMLSEYHKFWSSSKIEHAKKQGLSVNDVITLASIVQKETATISERPRVAGLYLNRLYKSWPLQADPTIIFALKQKHGDDFVVKRVLLKDLEIDSDYNTYKNRGLPPGPIAMPDISSINAVLNPEKHNYYYMCADVDNPGKHAFARTLSEHNRNAAKYQRWVSNQGITR